jgi:hypothetical protein
MAAKKLPSPVDLKRGDTEGPRKPGPGCLSCRSPWREWIRELVEDTIEKDEDYSLLQLLGFLKKRGYPRQHFAFYGHLRNHEPDLWERWNGRDTQSA